MVIREALAERVSGLKKRVPIETPVIDAVSLPAKIVSSTVIPLGKVDGIIPIIARGSAYGEVAGRWYRVTFARALPDAQVVAVAEGRAGEIPTPTAPTIATSKVELAKTIPVTIEVVTIPYLNEQFPSFSGKPEALVDALNTQRDMLYRVQGSCYGPYPHKGGGINFTIGQLNSILGRIKKAIEDTNASISDLRNKVQATLDEQRRNIDAAVNGGLANVLPLLYNAWGIPKTMAVTPLHVRNVTETGFDFQSYGKTTCRYIAVGSLR